jgi:cell fate (sporulation/competence/biofilm development) regulator YmcA (YheA/YmcA/DUF963 family)
MDKELDKALNELIAKINQDVSIQEYKETRKLAKNDRELSLLSEKIEEAQKDIVRLKHYGKIVAAEHKEAELQELWEEYNSNPLVMDYRNSLFEANDLLQFVTKKITEDINGAIEGEE